MPKVKAELDKRTKRFFCATQSLLKSVFYYRLPRRFFHFGATFKRILARKLLTLVGRFGHLWAQGVTPLEHKRVTALAAASADSPPVIVGPSRRATPPTDLAEAAGQIGNHYFAGPATWNKGRVHEITDYRGAHLVFSEAQDSDGWWYTEYDARFITEDGEIDVSLQHSRFDFSPTQEWFKNQVDKRIAESEHAPLSPTCYACIGFFGALGAVTVMVTINLLIGQLIKMGVL